MLVALVHLEAAGRCRRKVAHVALVPNTLVNAFLVLTQAELGRGLVLALVARVFDAVVPTSDMRLQCLMSQRHIVALVASIRLARVSVLLVVP